MTKTTVRDEQVAAKIAADIARNCETRESRLAPGHFARQCALWDEARAHGAGVEAAVLRMLVPPMVAR